MKRNNKIAVIVCTMFKLKYVLGLIIVLFSITWFSSCLPEDKLLDTNYMPVTVETSAATQITNKSAKIGGIISAPQDRILTRGVCLSTHENPTLDDFKANEQGGIGAFSFSVTGFQPGTTYYVKAYASNNSNIEIAYGNQVSFTTSNAPSIGDTFQGGKVAYILQSGDPGYIAGQTHGLIAATSDQSTSIKWYNVSNTTTGAVGIAIGSGNSNTNTIVTSQGSGSYAAKLCYDLILNGYSDWYLPSIDELYKLYLNKVAIGGFSDYYYWSSSEYNTNSALVQDFYNGNRGYYSKYNTINVRAVRAF